MTAGIMDRPGFPRWTIVNFVEALAEGSPMPGGGCAVSVVGALAAALGSLSGQISLKKETDPAQKDIWHDVQPQMDRARQHFLDLIDADALAYHEVVLARRRPHTTAAEKAARAEAIIEAFTQACEPPRQMARLGLEVLNWAMMLGRRGSPVILADVGVMGFLAAAVLHGGLINIFSNLTMMAGAPQALGLREEAERLRVELDRLSRELTELIYRQVGAAG
jgi:formiminotetrahydrofolate cyclodeaminase